MPHLVIVNAVSEKLLAMHEVVGCVGSDLLRRLVEISLLQSRNDIRGPLRDLFVQQSRRPATEEK